MNYLPDLPKAQKQIYEKLCKQHPAAHVLIETKAHATDDRFVYEAYTANADRNSTAGVLIDKFDASAGHRGNMGYFASVPSEAMLSIVAQLVERSQRVVLSVVARGLNDVPLQKADATYMRYTLKI